MSGAQALKVGSAVFGPEKSRKVRQPVASGLETAPWKGPRRQEVKLAGGPSLEDPDGATVPVPWGGPASPEAGTSPQGERLCRSCA